MNIKTSKEIAPVTKRIELLDIIRGFALVGILFANILSWSGIKFLDFDVIESFGNIEDDRMLYGFLKYFVDTKFYTIFSLLFGIGPVCCPAGFRYNLYVHICTSNSRNNTYCFENVPRHFTRGSSGRISIDELHNSFQDEFSQSYVAMV